MNDDAPPARRFSEKEAALILRRAVSLQESGGRSARDLSLEELRQIAAEVGVDPDLVTQASRAIEEQNRPLARFLGGPASFQFLSVHAGDVGASRDQAIIDEIRRVVGRHGRIRQTENSLEWQARDAFGGTFVTVSRVDEETRVRVIGVRNDAAITVFSLAGAAGLVAGILLVSSTGLGEGAMAVPTIAGVALATWGSARLLWSRISAGWSRRLRATVEAVSGVLERP